MTTYLLETGLSSDQNAAIERRSAGHRIRICYPNFDLLPPMAGGLEYADEYSEAAGARAFHARLIDGAIVQMDYEFVRDELHQHRLAWFPAPHLEDFLGSPDVYIADEPFGDVVGRRIVAFPIRFDYDRRFEVAFRADHPGSHLTLGQYHGCRIPVTRPVTPFAFLDFILRNFYLPSLSDPPELPASDQVFSECLASEHRALAHISVPGGRPQGRLRSLLR